MPAPPPEKLSRREREIMDAIFALGNRASAEDVRSRLTDPPSYSAVRAMLVKLEAKGFVRHRVEGLRYVYEPTRSRTVEQRSALDRAMIMMYPDSNVVVVMLSNILVDFGEPDAQEIGRIFLP